LQPLQEEDADELTVCPLAPLVTKPQADISLHTLVLAQSGQAGVSWPKTRLSNWQPQSLHWYSKMGMFCTPCSLEPMVNASCLPVHRPDDSKTDQL
jgi:hypothetical protein